MVGQRVFNVLLAEGKAGLLQILGIGPQHHNFLGCSACRQCQAIETIILDFLCPDTCKRIFEFQFDVFEMEGGIQRGQREIMDVHCRRMMALDDV